MSSGVPEGWSVAPLEEISLRIKRRNKVENKNVLTISAVDGLVSQKEFFNKIVASKDLTNYYLIKCGEFAYNKSYSTGYPVGAVRKLKRYDSGVVSPLYICFEILSETVDEDYAEYYFNSQYFIDEIQGIAKEGARNHGLLNIGIKEFFNIQIVSPPLPEQKKIAAILSSVDAVIEKTQAQIDKLKDLKTGMMQELLSPREGSRQAELMGYTEFKDSPLGRIPVEWEVVRIDSLLAENKNAMRSGPFGSALLKHELVESGIPYLGIDNVHVERFAKNYRRFVSQQKFDELVKFAVHAKDVMVTIMGTVGRCCVVPKGIGQALSSKHVWTMTFDQKKYLPELICWQINYANWVAEQFKNESQGGVMESISSKTLKALVVPQPTIEQQKTIAALHSHLSAYIDRKVDILSATKKIKKALMQDLLSGKVRVKVDAA